MKRLALTAAILIFPLVVRNSYYLSLAVLIGINSLVVMGLSLLLGQARQISLGQAAFFGIGAYSSALLTTRLGLNPFLALFLGLALTGVVAFLLALPAMKLRGYYLALATLAFGEIVFILINQWAGLTGGPAGVSGIPRLAPTELRSYYIVWPVALALFFLSLNLEHSRIGRALRAIGDNEPASATSGVSTYREKLKIFMLSALYASLAGSLYAHFLAFVSPNSASPLASIFFLIMVALGGMASLWGALPGAAILTGLPELFRSFARYDTLVYGVALIMIMMYMPRGIISGLARPKKGPPSSLLRPPDLLKSREMAHETLLEVSGLSRAFGGLVAVDSLTFTIRPGIIKSLVGPNGAGKTTVLNLINGLLTSQAGRITFRARTIQNRRPDFIARRRIARTYQTPCLFNSMTVLENVMVGRHRTSKAGLLPCAFRTARAKREEREITSSAFTILDLFGLLHRADLFPSALPFGEQRLVEMGRALASEPDLIILDEPASGLNQEEKGRLKEILKRMREAGITILLVEHDMPLVMEVSDEVIVLNYGRKVAEGTPEEIKDNPEVIEAYLGAQLDYD